MLASNLADSTDKLGGCVGQSGVEPGYPDLLPPVEDDDGVTRPVVVEGHFTADRFGSAVLGGATPPWRRVGP